MTVNKPSPSPSPERAIYGFVLYLASFFCLGVYLVWAYVPDQILNTIGLTYFPQKYWALAGPCYGVFCVIFLLVFYVAFNFLLTLPLDSINTIQDSRSKLVQVENLPPGAIPPLGDLPITEVNRILYANQQR